MVRNLAVLTILLLVGAFTFADCTRRAVVVQQPVQVKKVVVHEERLLVVPKLIAVKTYDDYHYYSLDPYYQQQALAAQILRQVRQELGQSKAQPKTQPKAGTEEGPAPKEDNVDEPGAYQNEELLQVVNNACAKCHGAGSKQTQRVTKDGKALANGSRGKVWEAFGLVNSGEMPKAGDNLNDNAVKLFYEWAKQARKK